MTEDKINALRQTDTNLRDALKMDEAERPQMPADLNERLMQRMAIKEEKKPRRIVWPWIAAACVAGVMMIWLMPPKETTTDVVAENTVIEQPTTNNNKVEETPVAKAETEVENPAIAQVKVRKRVQRNQKTMNTQITPTTQPAEPTTDLADVQETEVSTPLPSGEGKDGGVVVTLTERDIPVTRPENLRHTPEEIALLKKQANEAYLKWAELELEIAKYNLEQTAQK
jgi:hypothetical protein